ncbi:MAG: thioesterase family protein [Acidimicrobiales bacterium]|nr:thioesterase family protein [Acidimicrobiales bacterium]
MNGAASFDDAIAVRTAGEGRFDATIVEGWDVRGNPHGGYLLALVTRAMRHTVPQPDPLSVSATYLAPPRFGDAQVLVEVIRAGRRQSTVSARLVQDGIERVNAVATFGTLRDEPPHLYADDVAVPSIPPPEACLARELISTAEGEPIALHERLALRLHPDTGWVFGRPGGRAELAGWLRHPGREPDAYSVLMFSDGMPPSLFEAVGRQGVHTPTVQLTTHVFAHPAPGWVQGRFRTRLSAGGFLDEDGELWDSTGTLVATTRQLALLRTWEH